MPIVCRIKYPSARRNGSRWLSKDAIFEAVDRFYRAYYLRPKPILRIIKTMLKDKDVCIRRCREGFEFFKSLRQRKDDLAVSQAASKVVAATS
jgi:predicted nucleic-acid-binding protein